MVEVFGRFVDVDLHPADPAGEGAESRVVDQDDQDVGASAGGRSGSIGGNVASGSFASYVIRPS
jgi:hypothetical protein